MSTVVAVEPAPHDARRIHGLLANRTGQLAVCLLVGLALRIATFGDPNIHVDEGFYLLVGHEMHHGAVPYVDIWDRKPLGLFIAYWFFAFFANSVVAYQIGAWISASVTAYLICRIAIRWMPPASAMTGAVIYLAMLGPLLGRGGQSPVFYNALVAAGALLVFQYLDRRDDRRLYLAMLLLGTAITFKQTAAFESAFFGLIAWRCHGDWRKALLQVAFGAAPFLAISAWYLFNGYGPEFYHAMVTSNVDRPFIGAISLNHNAQLFVLLLAPLLGLAAYAFAFSPAELPRRLIAGWLVSAILGFLSVPYMLEHYSLPLLVPLCIIAGSAFSRRPAGIVLCAVVAGFGLLVTAPFAFAWHRNSRNGFDQTVAAIGRLPAHRELLVFDGPSMLYVATGTHPMSPLAFPGILMNNLDSNVLPLRPTAELERVIARKPAAVVLRELPEQPPLDQRAYAQLLKYTQERCGPAKRETAYSADGGPYVLLVYTGCR